jgi:hypothetical protein
MASLAIVDDLIQYFRSQQPSEVVVEMEAAAVLSPPFTIRFFCARILAWVVAPALLRSEVLKLPEQSWYPILCELVRGSALSRIFTATAEDFRFADGISVQDAQDISEAVAQKYQPHTSWSLR